MNKSESITNLAAAMAKAQAELGGAKKTQANSFFKSKYANLEEVINCVKEPFANNGLSFVQFPISGEDAAGVETIIMHESGEYIANEFLLKCAKTDPQGMGSAITYARRYGLQSAVGIPSEDDDGNAATRTPPMTKERAIELLSQAIDIKALQAAWKSIASESIATNNDVVALKDIRKNQLTTK